MVAQMVKDPLAMQETQVLPLSWKGPLEEHNPLQYACLENPMDRGTGGLQSMGSQRIEQD